MASLSARYGFADWKVIWNHPDNAELKQRRPKPGVLFEGDVVTIPDKTLKEEDRETGKSTASR
ncbi:MAG: hypothetical protein IPK82_39380 [Polyangiaceae bacterium]|nr:hypothetical protein [Polyangiaceae bacterium]